MIGRISSVAAAVVVAAASTVAFAQVPGGGRTYRVRMLPEGPATQSGIRDHIGTFDGSMIAAGFLLTPSGSQRAAFWSQTPAGPPTMTVIQSPGSDSSALSHVVDTVELGPVFAGAVEEEEEMMQMIWLNQGEIPEAVQSNRPIGVLNALEYARCQGALVFAATQADVNVAREAFIIEYEYDPVGNWKTTSLEPRMSDSFSDVHAIAVDDLTCEIIAGGTSGAFPGGTGSATIWRGVEDQYEKMTLPLPSSFTGTSVVTGFYEKGNKAAGYIAGYATDDTGKMSGVYWSYNAGSDAWDFMGALTPAPGFDDARVTDVAVVNGELVLVGNSFMDGDDVGDATIWGIGSSGLDGVCIESYIWGDAGECRLTDVRSLNAAGDVGLNMVDLVSGEVHASIMTPTSLANLLPDPGDAPGVNEFRVEGLEPGAACIFVAGVRAGATVIPSCSMQYADMVIQSNNVIGRVRADDAGVASLVINLSVGWDGRVVGVQAVSAGSCAVSNLVWNAY